MRTGERGKEGSKESREDGGEKWGSRVVRVSVGYRKSGWEGGEGTWVVDGVVAERWWWWQL